ncbi:MAG: hypothetical protein CFE44_11815 [Burkholderiales bacterium PBB4]|nr:MAG: hypothetical protein CFE44_11815 [Burkholderiales bacterium PBB4]
MGLGQQRALVGIDTHDQHAVPAVDQRIADAAQDGQEERVLEVLALLRVVWKRHGHCLHRLSTHDAGADIDRIVQGSRQLIDPRSRLFAQPWVIGQRARDR